MKKPTLLSLAETILVVTLLTVTHTGLAQTEITEQGFLVEHTVVIEASASSVYDALVNVSAWWQPDHTYTMDATNFRSKQRPVGVSANSFPVAVVWNTCAWSMPSLERCYGCKAVSVPYKVTGSTEA